MDVVLLVISLCSISQALFGVGVLMFGTPLLLIAGWDFRSALLVLLPVSVAINLAQIIVDRDSIDRNLAGRFLKYAVPMIPIGLVCALLFGAVADAGLIIGIYLVAMSVWVVKYARGSFPFLSSPWTLVLTGGIHGFTNMGGPILSLYVNNKSESKQGRRGTIALCYLVFALVQLLVIWVNPVTEGMANTIRWDCVMVGLGAFLVIQMTAFRVIENEVHRKVLNGLLFILGIFLIFKNLGRW